MSTLISKKRELLPKFNRLITKLAAMSGDIAKLELSDNEQASKRVRRALIEFKNVDLEDFHTEITNIRVDINVSKNRPIKKAKKPTMDLSLDRNINPQFHKNR